MELVSFHTDQQKDRGERKIQTARTIKHGATAFLKQQKMSDKTKAIHSCSPAFPPQLWPQSPGSRARELSWGKNTSSVT